MSVFAKNMHNYVENLYTALIVLFKSNRSYFNNALSNSPCWTQSRKYGPTIMCAHTTPRDGQTVLNPAPRRF